MGIVNVTPDSFSDGGVYEDTDAAVAHALALAEAGADLLDIGGESTRPGAAPVPLDEELGRVIPVVERLAPRVEVPISIDTQKAVVAERALDAGATIVNDVSGLNADPSMAESVARRNAALVMMHMKGTPRTMQHAPHYEDLFDDMRAYFRDGLAHAARAGVALERTVLDPGIGFGKTLAHNLALLAHPDAFAVLDRPLLVGVSRKSMFQQLIDAPVEARDDVTMATVAVLAFLGVSIVRVHDVARARDAVRIGNALREARAHGAVDVGRATLTGVTRRAGA